ncbi:hypothetical protein MKW94_027737 [Papaver nudicaule]|uniref:Pentatricopeptide repeat-containing protein n=1 Tax=Papaver nudicaule TaxID=74823 RepID=A0AA41VB33_PAPNU|nr:hypothetical protein [Papaver nudicaule]
MEEAKEWVKKMEESGVSPDCVTYNTLISGYSKAGNIWEAYGAMDEMLLKGLKMDIFTLNKTIAPEKGYDLDEVSYGTLIKGYFKEGDMDQALKLWDEMKKKEILPGVVTYNEKVVDAITYNTLIMGICRGGKFEDMLEFLSEMEEKKLGPDRYTFKGITRNLVEFGRTDEALEFLSKINETGKIPYRPCFAILEETISQELQKKNSQEVVACDLVDQDSSSGTTRTEHNDELFKEGKFKEADCILEEMTICEGKLRDANCVLEEMTNKVLST